MTIVSTEELQNNFDKYLNMVEEGREILIEVNGKLLCLAPFNVSTKDFPVPHKNREIQI